MAPIVCYYSPLLPGLSGERRTWRGIYSGGRYHGNFPSERLLVAVCFSAVNTPEAAEHEVPVRKPFTFLAIIS